MEENLKTLAETEENNENNTPVEVALKATFKALFWTITALAIFAACVFNFFPYEGMKFYSDLNLTVRAYETAQMYEGRNGKEYTATKNPDHNSKYADSLLMCVNLSLKLMNDSEGEAKAHYANDVIKYIDKYTLYDTLKKRTEAIDLYNINKTRQYNLHPTLYSYNNYIQVERAKAMLISGKSQTLLSEIQANMSPLSLEFMVTDSNVEQFLTYFNIISMYLDYEFAALNYTNYNEIPIDLAKHNYKRTERFSFLFTNAIGFTTIYTGLNSSFIKFKEYVEVFRTEETAHKLLKRVYYLQSLAKLTVRMTKMGYMMDLNHNFYENNRAEQAEDIKTTWDAHDKTTTIIPGGFYPLSAWYDNMLKEYVALMSK